MAAAAVEMQESSATVQLHCCGTADNYTNIKTGNWTSLMASFPG